MDHRAGPDALKKKNIYCPCRELNQDFSEVEPIVQSLYRQLSPGSKLPEEMLQIRLPAVAIVSKVTARNPLESSKNTH